MLFNRQVSSRSTPNFQPIFEKALQVYKKKTGKDLCDHPLAAEINSGSPRTILKLLEEQANKLIKYRRGDKRLTKWLIPTVNIINVLSAALDLGVSKIFPAIKIILSGIGILFVAAKDTAANGAVLVRLFEKIENFFERLKIYTAVPMSPALTVKLANTMAEVLIILGIATKGRKERRLKTFLKMAVGMDDDIKDALQRFDELERQELLMATAQILVNTTDPRGGIMTMGKKVLHKLRGCVSPIPSTTYIAGLHHLSGSGS